MRERVCEQWSMPVRVLPRQRLDMRNHTQRGGSLEAIGLQRTMCEEGARRDRIEERGGLKTRVTEMEVFMLAAATLCEV